MSEGSAYQKGTPLTPRGLFELVTDECYRDGKVGPDEHRLVLTLATALELDRQEATEIALRSKSRYQGGELGTERPFLPHQLYARVLRYVLSDGLVDPGERKLLEGLFRLLRLSADEHRNLLALVLADPDSIKSSGPCLMVMESVAGTDPVEGSAGTSPPAITEPAAVVQRTEPSLPEPAAAVATRPASPVVAPSSPPPAPTRPKRSERAGPDRPVDPGPLTLRPDPSYLHALNLCLVFAALILFHEGLTWTRPASSSSGEGLGLPVLASALLTVVSGTYAAWRYFEFWVLARRGVLVEATLGPAVAGGNRILTFVMTGKTHHALIAPDAGWTDRHPGPVHLWMIADPEKPSRRTIFFEEGVRAAKVAGYGG